MIPLKVTPFKRALISCSETSLGFLVGFFPGVPLLCLVLTLVLFPHLVEDVVKEQLEAAKPEPIIDEVVRAPRAAPFRARLCLPSSSHCLSPLPP